MTTPIARALLRRAAAGLPRVGAAQYEHQQLESSMRLAALQGQWPLVARLGAATGALALQDMPYPRVHSFDEHALQALMQQARAQLGGPAFDAACAAGRKGSLAQAVELALQWLDDDDATAV